MTVEPGFGGQRSWPTRRPRSPRRAGCSAAGQGTAVHVDGGVSSRDGGRRRRLGRRRVRRRLGAVPARPGRGRRGPAASGTAWAARRRASRAGLGTAAPDGVPPASVRPATRRCGCCSSGSRAPRCASTARWSGSIGPGLVVLVGVGHDDTDDVADAMADKAVDLRIFRDDDGQDQPVAGRRRRRDAGGQPVHAVRGHAQGPPAVVHRRRAAGAGRARSTSGSRTRSRRAASRWRGACSAPRWRSSSSTTVR